MAGASQAAVGLLPKNAALGKAVRRARNDVNQVPSDPQNLRELVIPESYSLLNGERFLLIDTGVDDPKRILVFGRESHQEWSNQAKKLYMDGTFKVSYNYNFCIISFFKISPPFFSQVFEILARRGSFVFPIFYALLPDKSGATYERLFELIKRERPEMIPESVAVDFEIGEFAAVSKAWPDCRIHGCFFHLNQSMWRQVGKLGKCADVF
jgi:hypothetical protein